MGRDALFDRVWARAGRSALSGTVRPWCAGTTIRPEWRRWLRLSGHTPEGLFLAHVMMRWITLPLVPGTLILSRNVKAADLFLPQEVALFVAVFDRIEEAMLFGRAGDRAPLAG